MTLKKMIPSIDEWWSLSIYIIPKMMHRKILYFRALWGSMSISCIWFVKHSSMNQIWCLSMWWVMKQCLSKSRNQWNSLSGLFLYLKIQWKLNWPKFIACIYTWELVSIQRTPLGSVSIQGTVSRYLYGITAISIFIWAVSIHSIGT